MQINTLVMNNFMSFKGEHKIDFTSLKELTLITGTNQDAYDSNGSGKTTILEAILWCLFGKTSKDVPSDSVINKSAKKDCVVTLTLNTEEMRYTISRCRKHSEYGNSVHITTGRRIDSSSTIIEGVDQQLWINALLGCDYQIFKNAFFFGQGMEKYFTQLTDRGQKEILSSLLNLDILEIMHSKCKILINECETDLAALEGKIVSVNSQLTLRGNDLTTATAKHKSFDVEQNDKIFEYENKIKELEASKVTIQTEHGTAIHDKKLKISELGINITTLTDRIAQAAQAIPGLERIVADKKEDKTKAIIATTTTKNDISKYTTELEQFKKLGGKCHTCKQAIPDEYKQTTIDHYTKLVEEATGKLDSANIELTEANNTLQEDTRKLTTVKDQKADDVEEKTTSVDDLSTLERGLASAEANLKLALEKVNSNISHSRKLVTEESARENPYKEQITQYEVEIATLTDRKDYLLEDIDLTKLLTAHREYLLEATSNRGAKTRILQNVTPFLNTAASKYSAALTEGAIDIKFNTVTQLQSGELRDKFTIDVLTTDGVNHYNELSGGERRRTNICVTLALRKLALQAISPDSRLSLGVYDEIFDGLDASGCEGVYRLLKDEYEGSGDVCLVISHNPEMEKNFDKIIQVVKADGYSTISE